MNLKLFDCKIRFATKPYFAHWIICKTIKVNCSSAILKYLYGKFHVVTLNYRPFHVVHKYFWNPHGDLSTVKTQSQTRYEYTHYLNLETWKPLKRWLDLIQKLMLINKWICSTCILILLAINLKNAYTICWVFHGANFQSVFQNVRMTRVAFLINIHVNIYKIAIIL